MNKVFLDANILYSNTLRSLFVWLHIDRAIDVFWSMEVWEEAFIAYGRTRSIAESSHFRATMTKNAITGYPNCIVRTPLAQAVGLKDFNDEHVVAAAKACNADYLVTQDEVLLAEDLTQHDITLIQPDDLIVNILIKETPWLVIQAVHDHIANLTTSKPSISFYLESLHKTKLSKLSHWLEAQRKSKKLFLEIW